MHIETARQLSPSDDLSPSEALALLERMGDDSLGAASPTAAMQRVSPATANPAAPLLSEEPAGADISDLLERELTALVLDTLKIEPHEFSPRRSLLDYGMDSISSTDMGNRFTEKYGIVIPPTVFFEFQDLQGLVGFLIANHGDVIAPQLKSDTTLRAQHPQNSRPTLTGETGAPVALSERASSHHAPERASSSPAPASQPRAASKPPAASGPADIETLWAALDASATRQAVVSPAKPSLYLATDSRATSSNAMERDPGPTRDFLAAQQNIVDAAQLISVTGPHGRKIEAAVYGRGRPVLLLGGLLMHFSVMWRLQVAEFGLRHRLIMFHMPGCGATDLYDKLSLQSVSTDVATLLDALGVDEPLPVIGYSFGGVIAQRFCIDHPARCAALAIAACSPHSRGATDFSSLMRELQKSQRFMEINRGWNIPALPIYEKIIGDFDFQEALRTISLPTLVISGSEDRYMSADDGRLIAEAVTGARFVEVPGAGHLLGFTHYAHYNRLVGEFLATVDRASRVTVSADATGLASNPAFVRPRPAALGLLKQYVQRGDQGHCAILSPQAAQVGLLLNRLMDRNKKSTARYHCFYLTSRHEALDAALRLLRHRARNANPKSSGEIWIIESAGRWESYFNPLGLESDDAFVPGIRFFASPQAAFAQCAGDNLPVAIAFDAIPATTSETLEDFLAECAERQIASVVIEPEESDLGLTAWVGHRISERADVYVLGEALSANQLPIGACLARDKICSHWQMTPNESYVRNVMSNFGFPLSLARESLLDAFPDLLDARTREQLRAIEADVEANYQAHLEYVNPGYAKVARLHGFDAHFHSARGMRSEMRTASGNLSHILDCFVNVGTCPRGLNPLDVSTDVAGSHDPEKDYWGELAERLAELTGLDRVLPASNNVTAVETALTIAALARPQRRKMLFFSGGLGFSLISAIGSHDKVFDIFRKPFEPIYRHSVFIDPADANAARDLEIQLRSGELGLVWFETIQVDANATRPLPAHLIALIEQHREHGGYLVGVDETQTNLMTGRFLHSLGLVQRPDIVAIGTALCDSLVPAGAVLCKTSVFQRAERSNPSRAAELMKRQQCQLAAHIGLNSLEKIFSDGLDAHAAAAGNRFKQALISVQREFPIIRDVRGEGLLLTIELDLDNEHLFVQRSFGYLLWGAMLRDPEQGVAIAVCPIHNNCLRFLPPLNIDDDEIRDIVDCLRRQLGKGVSGVLADCANHARDTGHSKAAEFLQGLADSRTKETSQMEFNSSATATLQSPRAGQSQSSAAGKSLSAALVRPLEPTKRTPRVCVIGAGVGGISAGKALSQAGIEFDCFDARSRIGGIWVFDETRRRTSVWHSLNQNTPRGLYQFSDFPMPDDYPDFPSHQQIQHYLERYVDHFGFRERIRLNTSVQRCTRKEDGTWTVTLDNGEEHEYDALVVANGHHNEPNFPNYHFRDKFDGSVIHSSSYRYREEYRDKKVLVVGIGNSGSQIAVDISHAASMTYISIRRGVYVLPHYLFGIRMDKAMSFLNDWWFKKLLPYPFFNLVHTGMYKLLIAKRKQMGMPKPDHLMMSSLPTLSENFGNRIGDGKLKIVPAVERIEGKRVHFADGTSQEIDAIVYSTGYKTTFPFFEKSFLNTEDNRIPMFKRIFVPNVDNLAFVGLFQAVTWGFLDMMELQAKVVADYFTGRYKLPGIEAQKRDIENDLKVIDKEFLATLRNNYEMHGPTYMHELRVEQKRGRKRATKAGFSLPVPARARTSPQPLERDADVLEPADKSVEPAVA